MEPIALLFAFGLGLTELYLKSQIGLHVTYLLQNSNEAFIIFCH